MTTRRITPFLAVVLLLLLSTPLTAQTGDIKVSVSTTGMSQEVGRYAVALDLQSRAIGVNDSVVFAEVPEGLHTVALLDVPEGCTVRRANPREAAVAADEVASVRFSVVCAPLGVEDRQRAREEAAARPPVERQAQRVQETPIVAPEVIEGFASEAISGYWDDRLGVPYGYPGKVIARLRVPAGSYVVFAKMEFSSHYDASGYVGCKLIAGDDIDRTQIEYVKPESGPEKWYNVAFFERAISLSVAHTFSLPGSVLLQCWTSTTRFDGSPYPGGVSQTKITAIRVGKLTNQPLEIVE